MVHFHMLYRNWCLHGITLDYIVSLLLCLTFSFLLIDSCLLDNHIAVGKYTYVYSMLVLEKIAKRVYRFRI